MRETFPKDTKTSLAKLPAKKVGPYTTMCAPYLSSTWPYATPFVEINQLAFHNDLLETPKPNPVRNQAFGFIPT